MPTNSYHERILSGRITTARALGVESAMNAATSDEDKGEIYRNAFASDYIQVVEDMADLREFFRLARATEINMDALVEKYADSPLIDQSVKNSMAAVIADWKTITSGFSTGT